MSSIKSYRELIRQAWAKYDAGIITNETRDQQLGYYVDIIEKEDADLAEHLRRQYNL